MVKPTASTATRQTEPSVMPLQKSLVAIVVTCREPLMAPSMGLGSVVVAVVDAQDDVVEVEGIVAGNAVVASTVVVVVAVDVADAIDAAANVVNAVADVVDDVADVVDALDVSGG